MPGYAYRDREAAASAEAVNSQAKPGQRLRYDGWLGSPWLQRTAHVLLLVAIVASTVNILTLSSSAKVLSVDPHADTTFLHSADVYQQAADQLLAASIWNHNKITINAVKISQQLHDQFPELATVSITLPLLAHRPIVYLAPSQPALILASDNSSYLLDTTGKALLSSSQLPVDKSLNIPLVHDQTGLAVQLNHQALRSTDVSFIQTVLAQLSAAHIPVGSIVLPPHASELDVAIASQPYFVKFNLQNNDARQQVGTYLATIAQLQTQNIVPAHYVDARVDGRAYYQ